mgnify:CR=1 FL=1
MGLALAARAAYGAGKAALSTGGRRALGRVGRTRAAKYLGRTRPGKWAKREYADWDSMPKNVKAELLRKGGMGGFVVEDLADKEGLLAEAWRGLTPKVKNAIMQTGAVAGRISRGEYPYSPQFEKALMNKIGKFATKQYRRYKSRRKG